MVVAVWCLAVILLVFALPRTQVRDFIWLSHGDRHGDEEEKDGSRDGDDDSVDADADDDDNDDNSNKTKRNDICLCLTKYSPMCMQLIKK